MTTAEQIHSGPYVRTLTYRTKWIDIDIRRWHDGRVSVWWTDGPRVDEEFYDTMADALQNVMFSISEDIANGYFSEEVTA